MQKQSISRIQERCATRICGVVSTKCASGDWVKNIEKQHIQPNSNGLQPNGNGLQPNSKGTAAGAEGRSRANPQSSEAAKQQRMSGSICADSFRP